MILKNLNKHLLISCVFFLLLLFSSPFDKAWSEEKVTLTLAAGAVGKELELTRKAAAMFEKKYPHIQVKVLDTPNMAQDRLGLYLQFFEAKSPDLDVYQIDIIWPGDLGEHFIDLNQYGAKKVAYEHFEVIVVNNTVNGRLVAIPWFIDAGLLYYRKDLLDKYKLTVPEKWVDLEKAAQTIQNGERAQGNQDFWGFLWQGDAYEGLTCNALEWIYSNGGGTIISNDKKITINNPRALEMIKRAAQWVGTISPEGVTGMAEEQTRYMWQSGNAAFMRNWPYAYTPGQRRNSPIRDLFGIAPLPAGKSGKSAATLGGWQLAVSKYSRHPDMAAKLALFLASYDIQKQRAIEASLNPTIKKLYKDPEVIASNPFFKDLYSVFTQAVARPSTVTAPYYNNVSQIFYKAVYSCLTGKKEPQNVLESLELDLEDLTGFKVIEK